MSSDAIRRGFESASSGFVDVVRQIGPGAWERPALGAWDVRSLVGHTARALTTIEAYLGESSPLPQVEGTVEYYLRVLSREVDAEARDKRDAAIAARGREAGAALGEDPAAPISTLAQRVQGLVARTPDEAPVASPAGPMMLIRYLPTRTFELTVHTLDLSRALGLAVPATLGPAVSASCELAGAVAGRRPNAPDLLLLLTGREDLPPGLTIL